MAVIEEALYTRLSGHAGLSALVGTRIYPSLAPQNATVPYVTYQRVSTLRERVMGGSTIQKRATFQCAAWGRKYSDVSAIAVQLVAALDNYAATVSGVEILVSFAQTEADLGYDQEGNLFGRVVDFEVTHR